MAFPGSLTARPFDNSSTVYGPVRSWRFGRSLGIDPIFETSTCSFDCVYCQLGRIRRVTRDWRVYVPTARVLDDFRGADREGLDVVAFSGSGEPSLASNLGEISDGIRGVDPVPQLILTNATEFVRPGVRANLRKLDRVVVKIDAPNERLFRMVNRPARGVTLEGCLRGIGRFREEYDGILEVQTMLMPLNRGEFLELAGILKRVSPSLVQLNAPERPYPLGWHRENRGNHEGVHDHPVRTLAILPRGEFERMGRELEELSGIPVSVRPAAAAPAESGPGTPRGGRAAVRARFSLSVEVSDQGCAGRPASVPPFGIFQIFESIDSGPGYPGVHGPPGPKSFCNDIPKKGLFFRALPCTIGCERGGLAQV